MMKAVKPKKNLGQHFLTDLNIAKRIADTVDACPDIPVLEIGPGMGVLTQYLVEKPRPVKAVEIDSESVVQIPMVISLVMHSLVLFLVHQVLPVHTSQ